MGLQEPRARVEEFQREGKGAKGFHLRKERPQSGAFGPKLRKPSVEIPQFAGHGGQILGSRLLFQVSQGEGGSFSQHPIYRTRFVLHQGIQETGHETRLAQRLIHLVKRGPGARHLPLLRGRGEKLTLAKTLKRSEDRLGHGSVDH